MINGNASNLRLGGIAKSKYSTNSLCTSKNKIPIKIKAVLKEGVLYLDCPNCKGLTRISIMNMDLLYKGCSIKKNCNKCSNRTLYSIYYDGEHEQ